MLTRRFERSSRSPDEAVFRRVYPQPDGLDQYQVAEVDERRYDSPQHELQALMRGDISMLIDLPPLGLRADPQGHPLFLPRLRDPDHARAAAQSAKRAAQESRAALGALLRHRRSANFVAADPPRSRIQGGPADHGTLCHDELCLQRPATAARIQHGHGLRPARGRGQAADHHSAAQTPVRTRSRGSVRRRRNHRANGNESASTPSWCRLRRQRIRRPRCAQSNGTSPIASCGWRSR